MVQNQRKKAYAPLPPLAKLNRLVKYDTLAGKLYSRNGLGGGSRVGPGDEFEAHRTGSVIVNTGDEQIGGGRVAWYMHTGEDPGDFVVGFADGNHTNLRPDNLRLWTRSQSTAFNRFMNPKTDTGYPYVRHTPRHGNFRVTVPITHLPGGKTLSHLGAFRNINEAFRAATEERCKDDTFTTAFDGNSVEEIMARFITRQKILGRRLPIPLVPKKTGPRVSAPKPTVGTWMDTHEIREFQAEAQPAHNIPLGEHWKAADKVARAAPPPPEVKNGMVEASTDRAPDGNVQSALLDLIKMKDETIRQRDEVIRIQDELISRLKNGGV